MRLNFWIYYRPLNSIPGAGYQRLHHPILVPTRSHHELPSCQDCIDTLLGTIEGQSLHIINEHLEEIGGLEILAECPDVAYRFTLHPWQEKPVTPPPVGEPA